jgi:hypothetical protein
MQRIIGVISLAIGVMLLVWGHNMAESIGSQVKQASRHSRCTACSRLSGHGNESEFSTMNARPDVKKNCKLHIGGHFLPPKK